MLLLLQKKDVAVGINIRSMHLHHCREAIFAGVGLFVLHEDIEEPSLDV